MDGVKSNVAAESEGDSNSTADIESRQVEETDVQSVMPQSLPESSQVDGGANKQVDAVIKRNITLPEHSRGKLAFVLDNVYSEQVGLQFWQPNFYAFILGFYRIIFN